MTSVELLQLRKENTKLRELFLMNNEKLERSTQVIQQLIGGLFHQETQSYTLNWMLDLLEGKSIDINEQINISPEKGSNWPTTRQGDDHEKRLLKLEETIKQLEKQVEKQEQKLYECPYNT